MPITYHSKLKKKLDWTPLTFTVFQKQIIIIIIFLCFILIAVLDAYIIWHTLFKKGGFHNA